MRTDTGESGKERADREMTELLQGLRVAVTGVQVLFAFLLTVPFSARFAESGSAQRWFLFVALVSAAVATTCYIAPAAQHRLLFRTGKKDLLVRRSNLYGICGSIALLVAMGTAVLFVVDMLFTSLLAAVTAAVVTALIAWAWLVQPALTGRRAR